MNPRCAKSSAVWNGKIQSKGFNFGAFQKSCRILSTASAPKLMAKALAIESCATISQVLFGTFSLKRKYEQEPSPAFAAIRAQGSLFAIAVLLSSCSLPSQTDLLVSSLRCAPSAFDSFRTNTEIRYTLAKPATVSIYIARRDATGQLVLVNTLARNIYETKGSHGHTWLGDTAAGVFAESGLYIAILEIENSRYETTVRIFHF